MTPYRAEGDHDWPSLLSLIREAFAYMDGRIDPPSSMHALTPASIADRASTGEVWVIGQPAAACLFLTSKPDALYLGKLAVAAPYRRQGLARRLVDHAETRARALDLPALELQTRVELVENQATFRALGFVEAARTAHPGYDRPTSITFRRPVP